MQKLKDIHPKYHKMLQPKKAQPNETDFDFLIPSGQFWYDLSIKEQDELRKIVSLEGKNLDDYLYEMKKMLPKTPRGKE